MHVAGTGRSRPWCGVVSAHGPLPHADPISDMCATVSTRRNTPGAAVPALNGKWDQCGRHGAMRHLWHQVMIQPAKLCVCMYTTNYYKQLRSGRRVYYMFVDESGSARVSADPSRNDDVYIQTGLIVHADDVHRARAAIDRVKRELSKGKDTKDWELHGYEVRRDKGAFAADLRVSDREERLTAFTSTIKAIKESEAVLISVIIWKNRLPPGQHNLLRTSWRLLTERYGQYLASCGGGEVGKIVADSSSRGTEAKIRGVLQEISKRRARIGSRLVLVSDYVRFVDSRSEPLVQAVDMVTYAIRRYCRNDASFKGCFEALAPSMWQRDGKIDGFGINYYPH